MFDFLRTIFRRRPALPQGQQYVGDTAEGKLYISMQKICPDCGVNPPEYIRGPSGGISINIFCSSCGAGFNITPMLEIAERIGKNPRYIIKEDEKRRRAI